LRLKQEVIAANYQQLVGSGASGGGGGGGGSGGAFSGIGPSALAHLPVKNCSIIDYSINQVDVGKYCTSVNPFVNLHRLHKY